MANDYSLLGPDNHRVTNNGEFVKRGEVWTTVTQPDDPAMALLNDPNVYSVPNDSIYNEGCYICVDPEFAAMGLPLCYPCDACGSHVPADDVECDNPECDWNAYEAWEEENAGND